MPDAFHITFDDRGLDGRLNHAPAFLSSLIDENMRSLGRRLAYLMGQAVRSHDAVGEGGHLSESGQSEWNPSAQQLTVWLGKRRGGVPIADVLEAGARAHTPPFAPIQAWAERRGLPAGAVWYTIVHTGQLAHPWFQQFVDRGDVRVALENTAERITRTLANFISGLGPGGSS